MLRVQQIRLGEAREWWLEVEAPPRVECTVQARFGDDRVELTGASAAACWSNGYADAMFWLRKHGLDQASVFGVCALRERSAPAC